ncbi:DUF983 domain-containing protein [Phenylobacterium sp. LjRoot219]|uniref:DUF983 domain-containing protein n=1 Tax=Phenylobacterium sp. LjRoot219 TaxID=3342283 RepID=UPI003ECE99D4
MTSPPEPNRRADVNPLLAGLRCRCPNCGEGPLFDGYLRVAPRCEACGQDLSRADSGDGPVVFILLIVGAIGCGGLLYTEFALRWPIWLELIVWLPLICIMTLGSLRPFKAILIALQFHNSASEVRHGPP